MCEVLSGHLRYCIQQPRMCVTKERRIISPHASGLGSDRRTPTETDQAKPASLKGAFTDRIPFKCLYSLDWGTSTVNFCSHLHIAFKCARSTRHPPKHSFSDRFGAY